MIATGDSAVKFSAVNVQKNHAAGSVAYQMRGKSIILFWLRLPDASRVKNGPAHYTMRSMLYANDQLDYYARMWVRRAKMRADKEKALQSAPQALSAR